MIDWNTYQAAYQAADQKTKDTLHSSLIPECVAEAVEKYELDAAHQKTLIGLFSEQVLGLVTVEKLIQQMRTAGIPAAAVISKEISQCLSTQKPTILDTSLEEEKPPVDEVVDAAEIPTVTPIVSTLEASQTLNNSLASDIAETEAALNAIPKIRTMVHDAQESTTHTSSQSELLDTNNRWGTKKQ
jgi:hypothetical protein